jgi:hypothetical protein
MQARWETTLQAFDVEKQNVRQQVAAAPSVHEQADAARAKVRRAAAGDGHGSTSI